MLLIYVYTQIVLCCGKWFSLFMTAVYQMDQNQDVGYRDSGLLRAARSQDLDC